MSYLDKIQYGGTTYDLGKPVDATLSLSGSPADAKEVGENLGRLDDALTDISTSNKNLWEDSASLTFVGTKTITLIHPLPAGDYVLSALITSSDIDATKSRFQINSSNITRDLNRDTRTSGWFSSPDPIESITFFASTKSNTSAGDTVTWANIQIEDGRYASDYVQHVVIAKDTIARSKIDRIVKFVSTSGNDNNDGNSSYTAYATLWKAISVAADVIYIANGTYTEPNGGENTEYRYRGVKIVGDNAVVNLGSQGLHFRFAHVDISGITFDASEASSSTSYGLYLLNCTGSLTNCVAIGAKAAGGFRLDGSKITLIRCVAHDCEVDGFNGHTISTGYETECTLIDCIAYNNGDDGASIHENGIMNVYGGEYYNNVQTGLAPHDKCVFEALNVHCHGNGIGIEAVKDTLASGDTPAVGRVIGCILNDNDTYGMVVKNYTVNALGNGYADNGSGSTNILTGGTINTFSQT